MKAAKTIDELYEEVKGYDIVVTADAALATALNGKLDRANLGGFAYTPKQIAAITENQTLRGPVMSDLEIAAAVMEDTGLGFRSVYSEMTQIRDVRKYTSEVPNFLATNAARDVWNTYKILPTKEKSMEAFGPEESYFFRGKKTAVIGIEFFNDLDKHFIPDEHHEIDLFKKGDYEIDKIYSIGNDRQIAECAVDIIKGRDPTDVAVVLDPSAPVADAVRASLYRERIPFKNELTVRDLSQVRDFLQFLSLSLDYETVRVGDVRDLFMSLGARDRRESPGLRVDDDQHLLSKMPLQEGRNDPVTVALRDTMRDARKLTFGEVLDRVFGAGRALARRKASVEILLKDMGLYDRKVTVQLADDLGFAVENVSDLKHNEQIPDNEKQGVLLADCHNALYIDRPLVLFLGMGTEWDVDLSGKEYVDQEAEAERNAMRMSILLQQGDVRLYMVRPAVDGKPARPCRHIADLMEDGKGDVFEDICKEVKTGSWHIPSEPVMQTFGSQDLEFTPEQAPDFSKSSYDDFAQCPISYLYGRFMKTADRDYNVFGDCLHEFAEMYMIHPELVEEKGAEYFLDRIADQYAGLSSECLSATDRDRLRLGMKNLMRFIDGKRPPEGVPLEEAEDRRYPNSLMEGEGVHTYSPLAETDMKSGRHMHAKFDMHFDDTVIDYKTGSPKTAKEVAEAMDPSGKGYLEFQPAVYLAVLADNYNLTKADFYQYYALANDIESTSEDFRPETENAVTISLDPRTRAELLNDEHEAICAAAGRNMMKISDNWGAIWPRLSERMESPGWESDPEIVSLIERASGYKESTVTSFLKNASRTAVVVGKNKAVIPKDALEGFVKKLGEDYQKAGEYLGKPFSEVPSGTLRCDRCDYRKVCLRANDLENAEGDDAE